MNKKYVGLFTSAGLACLPVMASAAGPSLSDVLVNSGITANGYVSASYNAFLNDANSSSGLQSPLFHEFDTHNNSFSLNQAAFTLSYLPSSGIGGVVNVIAGEDAKVINSSYGNGSSGDFSLTQAYLQYATGNLTVIAGRYVTLAGAEVIDDTKNANVSRSLLFTTMEPLVHTGVRASYKFSDLITGNLGVNNSAFAFPALNLAISFPPTGTDNDQHKTAEAGVVITPNSAITVAVTDYYGVDNIGGLSGDVKNNVLDVVGTWTVTPALSLGVNLDADNIAANGGNANAQGVALYASYAFTDSLKASLRGEYERAAIHPSGASGGQAHISEVTATLDYTVVKNFDVLAEVRDDYGSAEDASGNIGLFPNPSNLTSGDTKSQPEVLVKAIFKFGTPTGS